MVLQPDQQRVCTMLKDTITLLCKNGLVFKNKFCIEAVIGVTLDDKDMFHISMSQIVQSSVAASDEEDDENKSSSSEKPEINESKLKQRKRCRVKREVDNSGSSSEEDVSEYTTADANNSHRNGKNMHNTTGHHLQPNKVTKTENEFGEDGDEQDDIVFVKQEIDDNWSFSQVGMPRVPVSQSDTQNPELFHVSNRNVTNQNTSGWHIVNESASSTQLVIPENSQPAIRRDQSSVGFRGLCCPLCPKILTNNSGLRLHMDLHEGKYRYHCKVCQKGFMSSTTLKGHMTRHTGVKEYSCSLCHKEFGHKYSYRKHLIVIHHIQDEPQRTAA